jgi:hypothetical protein
MSDLISPGVGGGPANLIVTVEQPVATINFGAGYTQFAPEAGTTSFTLPAAGTYLCTFFGWFASFQTNATTGQIKIVFDLGAPAEQLIGDISSWQFRKGTTVSAVNHYVQVSFSARVVFAAGGAHTLVCYGKEIAGTTLMVIGTAGNLCGAFTIIFTQVTP